MKLVVESNLLPLRNLPIAVEPNSQLPIHGPLLGLGVRLARVVYKPRDVPFHRGVDDGVRPERHEIVVGILVFRVLDRADIELVGTYHLADVLQNELAATISET